MQSARFAVVLALYLPGFVDAADRHEIMASRYMKTNHCVDRALGREWWKARGVEMVMNRWGVSEPAMRTMRDQPEHVLKADAECRRAHELENERRPW